MENNRKGNGIFLGIVSVATLVVAIIGATFAYFSASTQSNEDAVNLTAYEFRLSMTVSPVFPNGASELIPLNADELLGETGKTKLEYALNTTGRAYDECIDDTGLQVCALYQVEIRNSNPNPITLGGQIRTVTNTPGEGTDRTEFVNLKYRSVKSSTDNPLNHDMTLLNAGDEIDEDQPTLLAVGKASLPSAPDGTVDIDPIYVPGAVGGEDGIGTALVLIYLEDTAGDENKENDDQSAEMGASYTGQLIYASTEDAGSTLTGTFNISG